MSLQTGPSDELELRVTTVGRTQPQLESKIIDDAGNLVPRGTIGELCTRGYSVMLGLLEQSRRHRASHRSGRLDAHR